MKYICSLCQQSVDGDVSDLKIHTEAHIIDIIKNKHPDWVEDDGLCPKCLQYFRDQMKPS
ncbi:MAG: hypothetical protein KC713_07870 [Candidatus Omnitrophica bacterium]|nr:hypothetical protein [Candidatus Omnitrophota bacterium]